MATRKPLVLVGGQVQELSAEDDIGISDKAIDLTMSAFLALAASTSLIPKRVYHIKDTRQIAIPTSGAAYDLWTRAGEQGLVVSATAPASPYTGQVWLQIP